MTTIINLDEAETDDVTEELLKCGMPVYVYQADVDGTSYLLLSEVEIDDDDIEDVVLQKIWGDGEEDDDGF